MYDISNSPSLGTTSGKIKDLKKPPRDTNFKMHNIMNPNYNTLVAEKPENDYFIDKYTPQKPPRNPI